MQYKILAASVTGNRSLVFKEGDVVDGSKLVEKDIPFLLNEEAIEEVKAEELDGE